MTTSDGAGAGLSAIEHIVVLMLENRSFDHMLGYLYPGNVTPAGQPFEGLTGNESNPDNSGKPVAVYPITQSTPSAYFMPGADPGEGFKATNGQLWGSTTAPASGHAGHDAGVRHRLRVHDRLGDHRQVDDRAGYHGRLDHGLLRAADAAVLSALAKGYAVCDHWYASAPTETMPNRAFALAATSQGHMDDHTKTFTCPSIFGSLTKAGVSWKIFGYDRQPLTKANFPDITGADPSHFGLFTDFQAAAAAGTLPAFTFLEPSWPSTGNSQHPNYDVALGEQLIHDTYEGLRTGPGWPKTLFVLTYDEHGGCYDHVPPPWGATPPDNSAGEFGFGFDRFGVRVPTCSSHRSSRRERSTASPTARTPLDHTSVLKTIQQRWNIPPLTARDAAAPGFGDVLTLTAPRTDDVLAGVTVPVSGSAGPSAGQVVPPPGRPRRALRRGTPPRPVPRPSATPRPPSRTRTSARTEPPGPRDRAGLLTA